MQEMTKKQVAAIQRVIDNCERRFDKITSEKSIRKYSGEVEIDNRIIVTDGYVAIIYNESQGLARNDEMPDETKQGFSRKMKEVGDYDAHVVTEPFDMRLCDHPQTWLKDRLKEAPMQSCTDGEAVDLCAPYGKHDDQKIKGRFNRKYIVNACEAVGKNAVCFLAKTDNGIPVLLVYQYVDGRLTRDNVFAMVMPVRTRD